MTRALLPSPLLSDDQHKACALLGVEMLARVPGLILWDVANGPDWSEGEPGRYTVEAVDSADWRLDGMIGEYDTLTDARAVMIGETFATMLAACLTPAQWAEMLERNRTVGAGVCASHDFCDSNMVMDPAFTAVMGREAEASSTDDAALWSAAWDHAKARHLTAGEA